MNRNKLVLIALAAAMLLNLMILTSCNELPYKGKENIKTPPSIFWSDIQRDSRNSRNPVLSWYSTDPDGLVLDYQFVVIIDSVVTRLGGPAAVAANFPSGYQWTIVHEDSSTVPLYASSDTSVYLPQYVFLQAMDDDSLYSNIIYKFLSRINHPPTCYVDVPTVIDGTRRWPDPQWCLDETTATWKGIRVAWVGKDSIDITGLQPDFEWQIRVYGPFPDSVSCDTVGPFMYLSDSTGSPDAWITAKEFKFRNLETGWHVVYARCRDDAYVPSVPALGYLNVFEPTWVRHPELTKSILFANHNYYAAPAGPYIDSIWGITQSELRNYYSDDVRAFYAQLADSAGYGPADYDWADYTMGNAELPVPMSDLYNHRLIIILDTDYSKALEEDVGKYQETSYKKYLDVGGKVWIIGRRTFDNLQGGRQDMPTTGKHSIGFTHFDLSSIYSPRPSLVDYAEFVGAISANPDFPNLQLDTIRVAQLNWQTRQYVSLDSSHTPWDTVFTNYRYHTFSRALGGIDYLTRLSDSETIYKFNSLYADTSRYHYFPVAIRKEVAGSYKTSYFCFPLYFIKTDQAVAVTRNMLAWFFED